MDLDEYSQGSGDLGQDVLGIIHVAKCPKSPISKVQLSSQAQVCYG